MEVHDALARKFRFELLVAAFAGFDELSVGSDQRVHILLLRRVERRQASLNARPFLPTSRCLSWSAGYSELA
jgi:hypothetical protein